MLSRFYFESKYLILGFEEMTPICKHDNSTAKENTAPEASLVKVLYELTMELLAVLWTILSSLECRSVYEWKKSLDKDSTQLKTSRKIPQIRILLVNLFDLLLQTTIYYYQLNVLSFRIYCRRGRYPTRDQKQTKSKRRKQKFVCFLKKFWALFRNWNPIMPKACPHVLRGLSWRNFTANSNRKSMDFAVSVQHLKRYYTQRHSIRLWATNWQTFAYNLAANFQNLLSFNTRSTDSYLTKPK